MDQCLNTQNFKLCPELKRNVDSIRKSGTMGGMKIIVTEIDTYMEKIYKLNPSLRPRK